MAKFQWFARDKDIHDLAASQATHQQRNFPGGGWSTRIKWVQTDDGEQHAGAVEGVHDSLWKRLFGG